jgi:flagellar hook-associated protein 1 FlgK
MSSLTSTLVSTANAMQVFTQALNVIGNNIDNVNTPEYADQNQSLVAAPFAPAEGITGGVIAGPLLSSRSEYLEQAVRTQQGALGDAQQRTTDLGQIQPLFDLTSTTGIDSAINNLFDSFSQLSTSPNDSINQQAVITQAGNLAQAVNSTAAGIDQVSTNITSQTGSVIDNINQIASQIVGINQQYAADSQATQDAGLDAQMHTALENLSQLANFTVLKSSDGAYNVYLGGQTLLVLGTSQFTVSAGGSSNQTAILDSQGNDITSEINQGSLGALIQEKNTILPGYTTQLNTLAKSLADTVNTQLSQGLDQSGNAPTVNLFTYDQASDAASTLAVTNITPSQIAAASAGAPGGNGNAIALAALGTTPAINGFTFTQYYGNLGAQVGNDMDNAQADQTQSQDQLTQAQTQVASQSGVSINAEATKLLEFQQAYEAAGKMVSVLQDMTQTVIDMVQPVTT